MTVESRKGRPTPSSSCLTIRCSNRALRSGESVQNSAWGSGSRRCRRGSALATAILADRSREAFPILRPARRVASCKVPARGLPSIDRFDGLGRSAGDHETSRRPDITAAAVSWLRRPQCWSASESGQTATDPISILDERNGSSAARCAASSGSVQPCRFVSDMRREASTMLLSALWSATTRAETPT